MIIRVSDLIAELDSLSDEEKKMRVLLVGSDDKVYKPSYVDVCGYDTKPSIRVKGSDGRISSYVAIRFGRLKYGTEEYD